MKPSDYKKAKEVVSSELAKVGLHGDVTINKLDWTALEIPDLSCDLIPTLRKPMMDKQ